MGITFGGPNVVEINFNEGKINFCNIHIIKPCHAPRSPFGKGKQYIFYLKLLCEHCIIGTMKVYSYLMKVFFIMSWPQSMFFSSK